MNIYLEKSIAPKDMCTPVFIPAVFTIARTWKQPKCPSTEAWIKMWYVYHGIFLSHKKVWNCAICRDMDGPRDYHIAWSQKEKNQYHILTQMWNLEKWYRWTYVHSRNRDTDIENKHMDTEGGRGVEWTETVIDIHVLLCLQQITNEH